MVQKGTIMVQNRPCNVNVIVAGNGHGNTSFIKFYTALGKGKNLNILPLAMGR